MAVSVIKDQGTYRINGNTEPNGQYRALYSSNSTKVTIVYAAVESRSIFPRTLITDIVKNDQGDTYSGFDEFNSTLRGFFLSASGSGEILFIFASEAERDAFFTANLFELFPGLNIITAGAVQVWVGEGDPDVYANTNWVSSGIQLTPSEIKVLYESNANTNALTDGLLEILQKLSLEPNGDIRSSVTFIFPPGSIQIGDTVMSSGGRVVTVRSNTTGNRGSIVIQRYDANSFMHPTFPDPDQSAQQFDIQTSASTVSSGITATNIRQVVQNAVQFQKIQFMPMGTLPTSFEFSVRLSETGETIYDETVLSSELTDLGAGVYELDLIDNPSQFDAGNNAYIRIEGLSLLGGNGFDGTDTVRFGDSSKSDFFPWLRSVSIPINRLRFASENYVNDHSRNDEEIFNVIADSVVAGMNMTVVRNDDDNTLTFNATGGSGGGTPPPADVDFIIFGLSASNNPATVDTSAFTREDNPTNPDAIQSPIATEGQYFIFYVPQSDDISSITDTVLNQPVTDIFDETDNVRVIDSISVKSYVIGPLNSGFNESYILNF